MEKTYKCDSCGVEEDKCNCGDFVSTRPITPEEEERIRSWEADLQASVNALPASFFE